MTASLNQLVSSAHGCNRGWLREPSGAAFRQFTPASALQQPAPFLNMDIQ
jgi:hypothetical protein